MISNYPRKIFHNVTNKFVISETNAKPMKKSLIFLLGITLTSFNVFHAQSDFLLEPISFKITDTLVVNEINQTEEFENL